MSGRRKIAESRSQEDGETASKDERLNRIDLKRAGRIGTGMRRCSGVRAGTKLA